MEAVPSTLGLALALFVSTNIDDVFILLALFATPHLATWRIVAGQCIGIAILVVGSILASAAAAAVASKYVGVFGIVPLGIGVFQAIQHFRGAREDDDDAVPKVAQSSGWAQLAAVVLLTLANGADNLGVYVPVFATQSTLELTVLGAVFMLLTLVWCWLGYWLVHHPTLGVPIRRYAQPLAPWVLIALGIYIMVEGDVLAAFS